MDFQRSPYPTTGTIKSKSPHKLQLPSRDGIVSKTETKATERREVEALNDFNIFASSLLRMSPKALTHFAQTN